MRRSEPRGNLCDTPLVPRRAIDSKGPTPSPALPEGAGSVQPDASRSGRGVASGHSQHGNSAVTALLALAFLAKLWFDLWALGRGFELGDEGVFLLNLNHSQDAPPPFEFYRFLGAFADGPWIGVVGARLLRLAAELAGSLALVVGVFSWAQKRVFPAQGVGFASFVALCLLGTLLSIASRSFGYNDATNLCVYAALGCVFALAGQGSDPASAKRRALAALAAGLLLGFQLWVKFPPALLWATITAGSILLGFRWLPSRERVRLAAVFAAGFAGGALFVVFGSGGFGPLMPRLEVTSVLPQLTGYHPSEILLRYVRYDLGTGLDALLFAGLFSGMAWLGQRYARMPRDLASCAGLALAAAVTFMVVARTHPAFLHPSVVTLAAGVVGCSLVLALYVVARDRRPEVWLPLVLLGVAPWVQIAGSNVTLTMRLSSHVLPLFVVMAIGLLDLRAREGLVRLHALAAVLAVAATSWLFVQHHALAPYGLRSPMHKQAYPVESLGVDVDLATQSFLEAVEESFAGAGYERGDPIVALDYMPGLVYLMGGTSPGFNFYMFHSEELNCFNLNRAEFAKLPFLVLGREMTEAQRSCIEVFDFPADFRLVRSFVFPYEAVYRGFGERGLTDVYLYAPNR